jgi:hypothetical protein
MPHRGSLDVTNLTMAGEALGRLVFGSELPEVLYKPAHLIGISLKGVCVNDRKK